MNRSSLVILPGALLPGRSYVFTLNATDPVGSNSADVPVTTARAPRGLRGAAVGSVSAVVSGGVGSTTRGIAFITVFSLSASNWADEDGPLLYQFQYIMNPVDSSGMPPAAPQAGTGEPGAIPPLAVILSPFSRLDSLSGVTFPAGLEARERNITVQLCATTALLRALPGPQHHRNTHA